VTRPWQQLEDEFQTFLEATPDGVVLVDGEGRIVRVNGHAERLFGYPRAELVGSPVEQLLPERFRDRHRAHRAGYHARPRTRAMGEGQELFGRRKDGTEFPVDISLGPVETQAGTVVVAAVRDATERRRAEDLSRRLAADELRRQQALELNDGVVQGLAAASMAMELGDTDRARALVADTLDSARAIVRHLLEEHGDAPLPPGALVRSAPAIVRRDRR
jgi:PAS domain S-box-containing protein